MIYRKYPLSELHPIKPVVEDEWRLTEIERSVRIFGFFVPLIITSDKKIIDGNKRWYALFKKYGYTWRVATVACDIPEEKIIVNPNGVDSEKFRPDIRAEHLIEKYRLKHKTVFGFIGTFGQWHGVENIAKAYGELLKNYPEYAEKTRLFLVGDGVKKGEVRQIVNKYGIERNVVFTGLIPQEKAPEYLSVCDILINATVPNPDGSEFFGSPTKLFEYMAMERAIISSNIGQMKEILKDGKTALLVKAGDVKALMLAMKKLADDKALRKHLGKNARKEVIEKYTWDKHVERILEGVERVVRDVEKVEGL